MKENFDTCKHNWTFHANAENGFCPGNSFCRCKECEQLITLEEKCAMEQTEALKKSLLIQENSLNVAKQAMIISAIVMICGMVGLWLEKIFK
ncbi:hypothetical protein HOO68_00150 [Candidatus Gracilibacteria bacterium]|nr:hypothetical protein [Candidatus Gracilibacteria bacterium]